MGIVLSRTYTGTVQPSSDQRLIKLLQLEMDAETMAKVISEKKQEMCKLLRDKNYLIWDCRKMASEARKMTAFSFFQTGLYKKEPFTYVMTDNEDIRNIYKTTKEIAQKAEEKGKLADLLQLEIGGEECLFKQITLEIDHERELIRARSSLANCSITDMPSAMLREIWQYLDLFHRQRLRRVCKRWKRGLSCPEMAHHIYLDAYSGYKLTDDLWWCGSDPKIRNKILLNFKYSDVVHVIYNGLFSESTQGYFVGRFRPRIYSFYDILVTAFPCVKTVDIMNVEYFEMENQHIDLTKNAVQIRLTNCYMPLMETVLWHKLNDYTAQNYLHTIHVGENASCWRKFGVDDNWNLALSNIKLFGYNYDGATWESILWPYPKEQDKWLAKYAPRLDGSANYLLDLLKCDYVYRFSNANSQQHKHRLLISQDNTVFPHLDAAFYRENIPPPVRLLMAFFLLHHGIPGVPPPPFPFPFDNLAKFNRYWRDEASYIYLCREEEQSNRFKVIKYAYPSTRYK